MSDTLAARERMAIQFVGYPAADLVRLGDADLHLVIAYADATVPVLSAYTLASHGWTRRENARADVRRLESRRMIAASELAARAAIRADADARYGDATVLEGCACPLCIGGSDAR